MERWIGRVAVVTGASSGIGAEIARQLAIKGLHVVGLARRKDKIEELSKKLPPNIKGSLKACQCSVTNEKEIRGAFEWIEKNAGPVSILVNNAGILRDANFQGKNSTDGWREMIETNVLGLSVCTRYALQMMRKHNIDDGHFININSAAGHTMPQIPEFAMYYASKHAVTVLTEGLRKELQILKSKIRITSISPGFVQTDIFKETDIIKEEHIPFIPALKTEDISDAVMYAIAAPPHVNIYEMIIKPVGEE